MVGKLIMVRLNNIYSPLKFFVYTIINILIAYTLFGICRLVFFISNLDYFPNIESNNILDIINGAFVFDTAGIIYMNIIYILLMLIPLPWRETKLWQKISKLIFEHLFFRYELGTCYMLGNVFRLWVTEM